jgi:hypothetical protein
MIVLSFAETRVSRSDVGWREHHEECHRLPEEFYHRDRFRAIRGTISDQEGKPISGALVQSVRLESLIDLAKTGEPSLSKWSVPVEAEATTNDEGLYEFPRLDVGARTFFYSAPGRDLSPAVKDLVVVQDGLGAQLNVTLARPSKLLVRLKSAAHAATRLYLIPQRWWPSLETATVPPGWRTVEFSHVGGPFGKGLIATAGPEDASPLRIIGRYDLDRSAEVVLSGNEMPVLRYDLPEVAGLEPWRFEPSTQERLFYAAMSPVPLFWREAPLGWPSWLPMPAFLRRLSSDPVGTDNQRSAAAAQSKPGGSPLQSSFLASTPPFSSLPGR